MKTAQFHALMHTALSPLVQPGAVIPLNASGQVWPVARWFAAENSPLPLIVYSQDSGAIDLALCSSNEMVIDASIAIFCADFDDAAALSDAAAVTLNGLAQCFEWAQGSIDYDRDVKAFIAALSAQFRV